MPIVSRTLTKLAERPDVQPGWAYWRVDGVDAKGRTYEHKGFGALQADAEIIRDTVTWDTAAEDLRDALKWVQAGNLLGTFDLTGRDITLEQAEEHVFAFFVSSKGDDAMTVVWWMDQFKVGEFNAIRNRIGYVQPAISEIPLRVSSMVNAIGHYDNTFEDPRLA